MLVGVKVGVFVDNGVFVGVKLAVGAGTGVLDGSLVASGVLVAVTSGVLVAVGNGVLVAVGNGVLVAVGSGVFVAVAVGVGVDGSCKEYSTCNRGAPVESPSKDSATRLPVPVIMITSELPLDQPTRLVIS